MRRGRYLIQPSLALRYCAFVHPGGYSNDELAALMADAESDLVERKRSLSASAAEKISRSICAFANDLPGHGRPGVVLVGVEDDGNCSGITIDDGLLKRLADLRDDGRLLPLPSIDVQRRDVGGCEVAAVIVQPSPNSPVRFEGRVWVRVGPTVRQASPADEQRLAERRRGSEVSFDLENAHGATLDDLDQNYIANEYLPRAIAADVLEANERSLEEQMRSLRLLNGDVPTNGALLAFGKDPQRWIPGGFVQFVRFDGDDVTDPIRNSRELTGRLDDVLASLSRLLELNVEARLDLTSAPREQRFPDYPVEALHQLVYNAVMHRNYAATNAPARVNWFSQRVEIESPGGLFGRVTVETIESGATDYRNPLMAEIMRNLGYAQRFGIGLAVARRALRDNGNPDLGFAPDHARVLVTVESAR